MLTFNSIDVETANENQASICQIGIVHVVNGKVADFWESLINPECQFNSINTSIHKIRKEDIAFSPTMPDVWDEIQLRLHGSILVHHSAFDKNAVKGSIARYTLRQLQVTWLDSMLIARQAWPERYAPRGGALREIANDFGISFQHHDALEDARVAAEIVLYACAETELDIDDWLN